MVRVSAKNINDLYYELNTLEEQKELYTYLSSDDMKEIMKTSSDIEIIVDTLNDEINNINNDILLKEGNIKSIEEEIDNLLIFNQISTGENTYLEYIFDNYLSKKDEEIANEPGAIEFKKRWLSIIQI